MKSSRHLSVSLLAAGTAALLGFSHPASAADEYKIVNSSQTMGSGGIDYVSADSADRKLYVPRNGQVLAFDLDTLKQVGTISNAPRGHGAAVDPKTHHAFSSSSPIAMWDSQSLEFIKSITPPPGCQPDGIFFEPFSGRVCILSHSEPNVTLIDPKDGSITGTIQLDGAVEQAASDGKGHMYVDLEDKGSVAVVDMKTMQKTGEYSLGGASGAAGLAIDAKNGILFAYCRQPATCVILSAADGKILDKLPIGNGCDGATFNPDTLEAFSSQGQTANLTIIKETSPASFAVEQTLATKAGAKTCTFDAKTGHVIVICTEAAPAPAATTMTNAPAAQTPPAGPGGAGFGGRRGGRGGPSYLDIIAIGK